MPILYMQEELITDEKGMPVELIYRKVNAQFEKYFLYKEDVIGKKASEIFPESMPEFLHFIKKALDENKAITFPYYFKKINTFYDVILKGTQHSNIIDVFCLDSTELHKAQQKLSTINNKLSMSLEVANIVPWKWDLQSHTILCDINKPIELSASGKDVAEEQLAVPDNQYFAKIFKEDRTRVEQAYKDLIEGRSDKVKEEYRIVNPHKGLHRIDWVEAQAAVETRDENGTPLTLVGSSLVITERKKMEQELVNASPVFYASANATLIACLDRLFYSTKFDKTMKVGASVVCARRGGCSATFDELNKYFTISDMPIASGQYWNCIHGRKVGEAALDEEGKQTMRGVARNMVFLMKSIALGKEAFGLPEKEKKVYTSFINP